MGKLSLVFSLAFVILFQKGFTMNEGNNDTVVGLTVQEKKFLLNLARQTIIHSLMEKKPDSVEPPSEKLKEKFGAFVTLHKKGNLRGCIGYIEGIKPLYQAVMDMALSAAFRDPRFPPVEKKEIPDLEIEISVLSPLKKIEDTKEIVIGTHGIIIQKGMRRGLLLPQVATEWNWDREEFLRQTCFKAGLMADAWREPETEIFIFSAEIFSEKELSGL